MSSGKPKTHTLGHQETGEIERLLWPLVPRELCVGDVIDALRERDQRIAAAEDAAVAVQCAADALGHSMLELLDDIAAELDVDTDDPLRGVLDQLREELSRADGDALDRALGELNEILGGEA